MSKFNSSYYHTCIIYPVDFLSHFLGWDDDDVYGDLQQYFFDALNQLSLRLDADFVCSPLHFGDDDSFKRHFHILFRLPNKMTGNAFESLLSSALYDNFNGVAYHKETCCVSKVDRLLRYFIHYDNPSKQQFDSYHSLLLVGNWQKEIYNAFSDYILNELIEFIIYQHKDLDYLCLNGYAYALTCSKNLYLINSLKKENDINKKGVN